MRGAVEKSSVACRQVRLSTNQEVFLLPSLLSLASFKQQGLESRYGLTLRPLMLCPGCALEYIEATGTSC
eukprot:1130565-Amphidinium_carterae.1